MSSRRTTPPQLPERVQQLRGKALVAGRHVDLSLEPPDPGAPSATSGTLLVTHPGHPAEKVLLAWAGTRVTARMPAPVSRAAALRHARALAAGEPAPEVRLRQVPFAEALAAVAVPVAPDVSDVPCCCCRVAAPPEAGLTVTGTHLCWACAAWHRAHAAALPDPGCPHAPAGPTGPEPRPGTSPEPWRLDPRASVDLEDGSGDLVAWFAARGHELVAGHAGSGAAYSLLPPGFRGGPIATVEQDWTTGAWTARTAGGAARDIAEPARHELLALLLSLQRPADRP